jgi:cytochrome b
LDAGLTTLICNKITVTKSKEVKIGCNLAESSKEGHGSKGAVLLMMMMMTMMICRKEEAGNMNVDDNFWLNQNEKLQKCTISFTMSVCPPHVTTTVHILKFVDKFQFRSNRTTITNI